MSEQLGSTVYKRICELASAEGIDRPQMVVTGASKNGDSYSGEVYRVVVTAAAKDDDDDCDQGHSSVDNSSITEMRFIAKVPPSNQARRLMYNSARHFTREKYMFDTVLPAFVNFQLKHLPPTQIFRNFPTLKAASACASDEFVLLNDLSSEGFANVDRPTPLDVQRCRLVLQHLARLHAISFAMKDQQPDELARLTDGGALDEIMFVEPLNAKFESFLQDNIRYVQSTLNDPINQEDVPVASKISEFGREYGQFMVRCCAERQDAVVLHGDCWISNMMFKGMDEMVLLDWQVSRYGTVAIDLSYFLFCCTDATLRQRLPELLTGYHRELTVRISALGSDGPKLFPFEKLQWHMANYARFGLGMAAMTLHATCCDANDLANVQNVLDTKDISDYGDVALPLVKNPVYRKRMSDVCRDLIRFGYL